MGRVAPGDLVRSGRLAEAHGRELADRLEHPEASFAVRLLRLQDETLLDKGGELGQVRVTDRLSRLDRPAAGEDRKAGEQRLFALVEQAVAPLDRRAQRLLARRQIARAPGGELETMRQDVEHPRG